LSLRPLKKETMSHVKNCESQTKIKQTKQSQTKKINARTQQDISLVATAQTKMADKSPKENPESRTPTKSCGKIKPKGNW
jgi:hypothetical protein